MPTRFNAQGSTGVVAIYTVPSIDSTDDAPMTAPLAHKDRIRFHSGLGYPARIATLTGTLSLPARTTSSTSITPGSGSQGYQVAAHGRPGIPLLEGGRIIGRASADGGASYAGDVPWCGTVPVQGATNLGFGCVRWLTLGADATYIYVHEMWGVYNSNVVLPALTVSYEVHVLDRVFTP